MIKELYRTKDQYGEIIVTEQAGKRILSFGSSLQQSAIDINKPYSPVHEYTRIMLLGLAFVEAKNIIILGLGGGGLVHGLAYFYPKVKLQAVEIRKSVIDIAYQWFDLPKQKNLTVYCNDAAQHVHQLKPASTDIIFSDLYEAQGMSEIQLQVDFIADSFKSLRDIGCLVINFHSLPADDSILMKQVQCLFSDILICEVFKGNWILLCIKHTFDLDDCELKLRVRQLAKKLNLPMNYYFKQLRKVAV